MPVYDFYRCTNETWQKIWIYFQFSFSNIWQFFYIFQKWKRFNNRFSLILTHTSLLCCRQSLALPLIFYGVHQSLLLQCMWEWQKQDDVASWDTGRKTWVSAFWILTVFLRAQISKTKLRKCWEYSGKESVSGRGRSWELEYWAKSKAAG